MPPRMAPTPTIPDPVSPVLEARQRETTIIIPSTYGGIDSSPNPGVVAGIVLGAVAGFLLLLFLIYTCLGFGPPVIPESEMSARPKHRHSHSHSHSHRHSHHHHRRGSARVTERVRVNVRESGGGATGRPRGPGEPIIVDAPPPPAPPPPRGGGMEEEDDDEDEVVVIEENTPPRRKKKRHSGGGERRRDSGGFREVDPERFAGGDAPIRHVRRSRDY